MVKIEYDVDMTRRNTFGMKVCAAAVVEYDSVSDLEEIRRRPDLYSPNVPILHIGACSNLLFTKDRYPGILFHSNIRFIRPLPPSAGCSDCVDVEVGAGVVFDDFCAWASERGLWGVENLSGIPGEVGAAAVQNIGAYGMEVKDAILKVNCYDMNIGRQVSFSADDCGYGYRTSLFKTHRKGRYIVTSVTFRLSAAPRPVLGYGHLRTAVETALFAKTAAVETDLSAKTDAIQTALSAETAAIETVLSPETDAALAPQLIRDVVLRTRAAKLPDPAQVGSAGSFFKNPVVPRSDYDRVENIARFEQGPDYKVPCFDVGSGFVKIPAAWLIEHCGWKGRSMGNAAVWESQPLVLVNATGRATAAEILALESAVTASVRDKYGIALTPEVEHV